MYSMHCKLVPSCEVIFMDFCIKLRTRDNAGVGDPLGSLFLKVTWPWEELSCESPHDENILLYQSWALPCCNITSQPYFFTC